VDEEKLRVFTAESWHGEDPLQCDRAAAQVLPSFFRRDCFDFEVTSKVLRAAVRCFESFSAAAEEATLSRVFAGQRFRFDRAARSCLERRVADTVFDHLLTARERRGLVTGQEPAEPARSDFLPRA